MQQNDPTQRLCLRDQAMRKSMETKAAEKSSDLCIACNADLPQVVLRKCVECNKKYHHMCQTSDETGKKCNNCFNRVCTPVSAGVSTSASETNVVDNCTKWTAEPHETEDNADQSVVAIDCSFDLVGKKEGKHTTV